MDNKDNFSQQAELYAKYRPQYPDELYEFIFSKVKHFDSAWDCATGNGQVAKVLSNHFTLVEATDISAKQIENAFLEGNIHYAVQIAEKTFFKNQSFDLITVGQALHWFNFDEFFNEVKRILKAEGVFAAWCYGLNTVHPEIDAITQHFYQEIVGPFWDKERTHIEKKYESITFPFQEITSKDFNYKVEWTADEYLGYLSTWSSVQHFIKIKNSNPIELISQELIDKWGMNKRTVTFPIHLKLVCL
ncbi:MAG: class I SAM-dependent methyltransferase [Bacteroidetes bacterium]|nr:class I SAM-dependent methyltransferase [Bacteroidota bacterium]